MRSRHLVALLALSLAQSRSRLAVADSHKLLVLQSEGRASAATRAKVDAAIVKLARATEPQAAAGELSFTDAATAVGCKPDAASCKDEVLAMLGVDEIVTARVMPKPGGLQIEVHRFAKGSPPRDARTFVATGASPGKLDAIASLFREPSAAIVEPARTEPTRIAPPRQDPARTEPTRTDSTRSASVRVDPARPDPARPEPARVDPARPDPARPEPARPDPVRTEPSRIEPARPDPVRTEPTRPDPVRAEAVPTDPAPTDPGVSPAPLTTEQQLASEGITVLPVGEPKSQPIAPATRRHLEVVGMAGGGALVAAGVVLWAAARGVQSDINNAPSVTGQDLKNLRDLESKGDRYATIGNVLIATGLVVGGVATYLYIRDRRAGSTRTARLTPTLLDHGAGLVLTLGAIP